MISLYNLKKIRLKRSVVFTFFSIAFVIAITLAVYARSNGYTGVTSSTSSGCNCHSTSASSNVSLSVSSESGSFTVQAGSTTNFTITVSSSNSNHRSVGIDIAVKTTTTGETNAGTLTPGSGSGLQLSSGELTHSSPKSLQSGSATFTFSWTAPSQPGNYYLRAIANCVNGNGSADANDQWNRLAIQTIIVQEAPSITVNSPNGGEIWCPGISRNITWTATAIQNVNIAISSDNGANYTDLATNIPANSGSWTWNIPNGQTPGNQYLIKISSSTDASINDASNSPFTIGEPPQITEQPQSINACTGQSVSFRVAATGSGLTYVWRRNGTNIPNSNSATFNINPVTLNSAGTYDCIVTGACGSPITSSSATLTVDESPTITRQPQPKLVCVGDQAILSIGATGTEITYQWRKGGNPISGANDSTLTIFNVQKSDEALYDCVVSGKCTPSRTSVQVKLTVNEPPQITAQPKSSNTCEGGKATFKVSAKGTDLKFQWRKNGNNIPNATDSILTIDKVSVNDLGTYDVVVSGACPPQQFSETAIINIIKAPEITLQPTDATVSEGSDVDFTVAAKGEKLKFQWMKDGKDLQGKTTADLHLKNVQKSDAGKYSCKITNDCGTVTSKEATLTVNDASANPQLSLLHTALDFGQTIINTQKDTLFSGLIRNIGTKTLTITKITITGNDASDFQISGITLPISLNKGESSDIIISFTPKSDGQKSAFLEFESNSETNPKFSIIGLAGDILLELPTSPFLLSTTSVDIPTERQLIIVNNGTLDADLSLSITGEDASAFSIKDDKSNINIKSKASDYVTIRFEPKKSEESNANLTILISGKNEPVTLALKGNISTSVDESLITTGVNIFPNPSSSILNFSINSVSTDLISIQIFDINGIEYFSLNNLPITNGSYEFSWDGTDKNGKKAPSGFYSLRLSAGKKIKNFGFILSK
ncbi:MAG: immunoglobulin domain-containing protein [Candidatus Kapabacteria bacterium]|nr:immunoglobulin domain-containing protein [Candidatus Kapabacteria bacterium]